MQNISLNVTKFKFKQSFKNVPAMNWHTWPTVYPSVLFRINHGRTKGYEADVGTRTTHHIMYPESAVDLDNSTHLVLVPFMIQDLEWLMKAFTTGFYGKWDIFLCTTYSKCDHLSTPCVQSVGYRETETERIFCNIY